MQKQRYELDNCPFCNSDDFDLRSGFISVRDYIGNAWWVECLYCECAGPIGKTEEEAIKNWNNRIAKFNQPVDC